MKSYNHSTVFSGLVIDREQISDAKTQVVLFRWELLNRLRERTACLILP